MAGVFCTTQMFETYAGLRNIDEHLDERAPDGSVVHEKRELMTRATVSVAHPRAQRTDVTTQASEEEPISQPPASQSSQQDAYTGYWWPVIYPLHRSEPRGLCLILNTVTFADSFDQPALRQRVGSRADVINITNIFQNKLHYIVKLHENLGKTELLECITYYLQHNDFHAKADAFILFIMSHGEQETIICADRARVKYSELVNLISQQQCTTMHGKPKFVFIQACQGDKVQTAVPVELGSFFRSFASNAQSAHSQTSIHHSQSTSVQFLQETFSPSVHDLTQTTLQSSIHDLHISSTSAHFPHMTQATQEAFPQIAGFNILAAEFVQNPKPEDELSGEIGPPHPHGDQEKNKMYIPEHGCDLLLGLSTVSDYSSALHDIHGSWYFQVDSLPFTISGFTGEISEL